MTNNQSLQTTQAVKPSVFDRVIQYLAPQWGMRRIQARSHYQMLRAAGYVAAGGGRWAKGWSPSTRSADVDAVEDGETLRQRSYDLYINTPLATGAIRTVRTNVVGSGLQLQPRIDRQALNMTEEEADEWERRTERLWRQWANTPECDAARVQDFAGLQQIAFTSAFVAGDAFSLLPRFRRRGSPFRLKVQLIEPERVSNPGYRLNTARLAGGIETDSRGAPVAYHIRRASPGGYDIVFQWDRVLAFGRRSGRRNVLHLFDQEFPGRRRGVPYLAPVIQSLKQLGRYTDAELMAAVVGGMFTAFVKTQNPENDIRPSYADEDLADKDDDHTWELGNGTVVSLGPNEEIQTANPSRPNDSFDQFVLSMIRQIGSALEIPYELLVKHFTASYSASRGALLEAWKFFRQRRRWLAAHFCQPVYEEWLTEQIANGLIEAPGFFEDFETRQAYLHASWVGDAAGQLDPVKETQAAKMRVEQVFSTRSDESRSMTGSDFEANLHQREREERSLQEAGIDPPESTS